MVKYNPIYMIANDGQANTCDIYQSRIPRWRSAKSTKSNKHKEQTRKKTDESLDSMKYFTE